MAATLSLCLADLQAALFRVEPAVILTPPRILRRVIKNDCHLGGIGLQAPHRKSYFLTSEALLQIASRSELKLDPDRILPPTVILIQIPDLEYEASRRPGETLQKYWRLLFHARIHLACRDLCVSGEWSEAKVKERIACIGLVEFEEIKAVLAQDDLLLPPISPESEEAALLEEFAARYLELRHFDPKRLPWTFPSIVNLEAIDRLLAKDIDAADLLASTRLAGALDLPTQDRAPPPSQETVQEDLPAELPPVASQQPDPIAHRSLMMRAKRAASRGNQVRAAVLRQMALRISPPEEAAATQRLARAETERLASRLRRALGAPDGETEVWTYCLLALLEPASRGRWTVETRLLYDLQKVCLDQEREVYAADLVEWFVSWFRRPIKRALPLQPQVLVVKHLRGAARRLLSARLVEDARRRLTALLQAAVDHAEEKLRDQIRPHLDRALDEVNLAPTNSAERVARDKLVEELLDSVVQKGFLTLGDLRDTLARNRLKLPDLTGPIELVMGDPLLRANRQLAYDVDGIYRRGEIYLRWLQRLSSVFFGNPVGRFLTLFLLLPVGAAFFTLKGIDGISEEFHHYLHFPKVHTFNLNSFVCLSVLMLPLLHWPRFRKEVIKLLRIAWQGIRGLAYDLPSWVVRHPAVRRVLQSKVYLFAYQLVLKPGFFGCLGGLLLFFLGGQAWQAVVAAGLLAALASAVLNSRFGLLLEEWWADRMVRAWHVLSRDLVPGMFRFVMYLSNLVLEHVDRFLYSVDEWLRFRSGESRVVFVLKLIFGYVWFLITYVLRFAINLLIEPQINPVKHFPVVTVSHKLMLLLGPPISQKFGIALPVVIGVLGLIPGIFGFLVWELKENWRLYRANQPLTLRPVTIGSHGEAMIHLLRPGFHSGTLPKLFAKLRRARPSAARRLRADLHHVEEALRHFAERNLAAVLASAPDWGHAAALAVGEIHLGTNRAEIELVCPGLGPESLTVAFEQRARWLFASVRRPGWLACLTTGQRQTLNDALAGLYALAGVDVVGDQIESALPRGMTYELSSNGLLAGGFLYDLGDPDTPPQAIVASACQRIGANDLVFSRIPISWDAWVARWRRDRTAMESPLFPTFHLLPAVQLVPDVACSER
jgi:hypothetical protein